jgi:uncharacterized protein (DUF58 family)
MALPTSSRSTLLDPEFLRKLDRLSLVARKLATGKIRGERRSRKKGISVDFADYRDYAKGDDLRFIDWNIFGRLDRLFLKLFQEEEDLHVYLLIDTSLSMNFGEVTKFDYSRRLAAALGYLALVNYDRLAVTAFHADATTRLDPIRTRNQVWKLFGFLEDLGCQGLTDLPACCKDFSIRHPRRGIVVLLSDFMDPSGYEAALTPLLARRHEIFAIQILAPEEADPGYRGHLKVVDSETDEEVEITLNESLRGIYRSKMAAYVESLRDYCSARGIYYLSSRTDFEIERLVLDYLRRVGFVR